MALFGAGTWPMMILAGTGVSLIGPRARRRVLQVAAWCVMLTGAITLARGLGYLDLPFGENTVKACPFCH